MKICILKKSLSDLKNPIVKSEYDTDAKTVGGFICEMVGKNYRKKKPDMTLEDCKRLAMDEFSDGSYYIVNTTKDIKYSVLEQSTEFDDGDEIVLIRLKYVRGIIWT